MDFLTKTADSQRGLPDSIRLPSSWNVEFLTELMEFHASDFDFLKPDPSPGSPFNKAANFQRFERGSPDPGAEAPQHYVKAFYSFLGPVWEVRAEIIMSTPCMETLHVGKVREKIGEMDRGGATEKGGSALSDKKAINLGRSFFS